MAITPEMQTYIGRFAPSPSGPLHFGSLVCALASYLHAQQHQGKWLVRIEDIDPPREQAGATASILATLQAHGLISDDEVLYQSTRAQAYRNVLTNLQKQGVIYPCNCTRKRLQTLAGQYDGHCFNYPPARNEACALRFKIPQQSAVIQFVDEIQGSQCKDLGLEGDFIVHRKDGLFAYQLAVVVDDIFQQVTHVVRGEDLLETTANQIILHQALLKTPPHYAHIPVVLDKNGNKLSKQNHAPAVNNQTAEQNLRHALAFLGVNAPLELTTVSQLIHHGVVNFQAQRLRKTTISN